MLFIHNDVQKQNLTMAECIAVQEDAFKKIPAGGSVQRPKTDLCFPCDRDDGYFRFSSMEGAYDGIYAMRVISGIVVWPRHEDGTWTEEEWSGQPGRWCGLVYLFSTENAEPLAILNDGWVQHMRVAGGAGLGVKYLSREDSHVVGMLGSGEMARTHLEAYLEVRDIRQVKVYSPTPANREAYAAEMSDRFGIEVIPVASTREAIRGVDILSPCTDSMEPVYDADWLEPGMHVVALQTQETSHEAAARFDVKIRQGIDCMHLSAEQESPRVRRTSGLSWTAFVGGSEAEMKRIPEDSPHRLPVENYAHFADLANGTVPGRVGRDQITFYFNNGNQGIQFASVGGRIYRNVIVNGGAREMPTEWFMEDMRA
jgi:alanine dehydrogenase